MFEAEDDSDVLRCLFLVILVFAELEDELLPVFRSFLSFFVLLLDDEEEEEEEEEDGIFLLSDVETSSVGERASKP